jgi:hypothetical protein
MNWLMISEVCSGIGIGSFAFSRARKWVDDKVTDLKLEISGIDRKVRSYNEQFIIPKSEFLYKWNDTPGRDDDMEIIDWCLDRGVKFKYHRDTCSPHSYPKDAFEVWITEPRLAMEFKLRFYNVT